MIVEKHSKTSVKIPVVLLKIGTVQVTVRLNTELGGEQVSYDISVKVIIH